MMVYLVLALIFAFFVAVFAVQNAGHITLAFLAWHWDTSVAVVILGAAALGGLFGGLMASVREVRFKLRTRNLQSEIRRLEVQIEEKTKENEKLEMLVREVHPQRLDN
ncbi:MAG: LapA family protein [Firmicutes bacterium]|nr:LapA family protein [Bacillota bacterium]